MMFSTSGAGLRAIRVLSAALHLRIFGGKLASADMVQRGRGLAGVPNRGFLQGHFCAPCRMRSTSTALYWTR